MRRRSARFLIMALLVGFWGSQSLPALADDAQVEVRVVAASTSDITLEGSLTANGQALGQRDLTIAINNQDIGQVRTQDNGQFRATLPVAMQDGEYVANARFAGEGNIAGASASVGFSVGAPAQPAPSVTIQATAPSDTTNGAMVSISGTVSANGVGLEGAAVSVEDSGGEVADSYAVTGAGGQFQTMYLVSEEQAEGELKLTLRTAQSGIYPSATQELSLKVTHLDLETPQEPESAQPVATEQAAAPSVSASPTPEAAPVTEATRPQTTNWFTITVIALAMVSLAALAFMISRAFLARRRRPDASDQTGVLDLLDAGEEPDPGSSAPQSAVPPNPYEPQSPQVAQPPLSAPPTRTYPAVPVADLENTHPLPRIDVEADPPQGAPDQVPPSPRRGLPSD